MKIVFISRYQGKVERGVENYVKELGQRLGGKHQIEILTSAWQLIGRRPDIIYPLNGYWQAFGCRLCSWLTGTKLVLGGHAGIGRDDRWNLYMFPDLFIAFSQKGYEWAKKVNPFIKIVKIPHGVDLEKFNPNVKQADVNLERPIFITVSHLVSYKRVGEVVKAVAKLERGSLLILGEGPLEKKIDALGNRLLNGLSSRAKRGDLTRLPRRPVPRNDGESKRYLRLVTPHNQVAKYLRAADVFTLASESYEAFGLVYLEAIACNLPVVATDDSLRREMIGSSGVFVKNPEDNEEYARCLETAAKIDWRDKPVKQAKKFDWKKIAVRYLEEFEGII
ncbi:glycosyltransferase [Candidatus Collierbacteria bacterium]|nr:glycosyltransferase [Candidatus Collierbacteria bacterium]